MMQLQTRNLVSVVIVYADMCNWLTFSVFMVEVAGLRKVNDISNAATYILIDVSLSKCSCLTVTWAAILKEIMALLLTWINFNLSMDKTSNYTHHEVWGDIICPSPNLNGETVEIWDE